MSQMPDEDRELDAFLARESPLQKQWRALPDEEPPNEVDTALRAAARRAVHAGPRAGGRSQVSRWRFPLAIAATLVIGSSLTLMVAQHEPPLGADRAASAPARMQSAPAAPRASEPAAIERAHEMAPATDASANNDGTASSAVAEAPRKAAPPPAAKAAPKSASGGSTEARRDAVAKIEALPDTGPAASVPAQIRAAPEGLPDVQDKAALPPSVEWLRDSNRRYESAPLAQRTIDEAEAQRAPPDAVHAPAPAAVIPPASDAMPARSRARPAAPPVSTNSYSEPAAAAWIERIRALRQAGKADAADRELRAFRLRYPDYELPDDLKRRSTTAPASDPNPQRNPGRE